MRLLLDSPAHGSWNMAFDQALLEGLDAGYSEPTLRFYDWDPPSLSLGYAQDPTDVDFEACERLGVDVVRRPTGGRAVLHVRELTYAVTMPAGQESVADSYCRISQAIARALARLGLAAELEAGDTRGRARSPDCFALSTAADLLAGGRKLVGSAQVRRKGYLLQHGSIKLAPAPISMADLLVSGAMAAAPAFIAEFLGDPDEDLVERLERHISDELGVAWQPSAPAEDELTLARAIEARTSFGRRPPGRGEEPLPAAD